MGKATEETRKKARAKKKAADAAGAEAGDSKQLIARCRFEDSEAVYEIDLLDLTSEEEIMIETHFDRPLSQLDAEGWVRASATGRVFLAFLARRRQEPDFTFEQAVKFNAQAAERAKEDEAARPTNAPTATGSQD